MQRFGQILGKSFGVPNGRSYGAEEVSSFAMTDPRQTRAVNSPERLRQSVKDQASVVVFNAAFEKGVLTGAWSCFRGSSRGWRT